MSTRLRRREPVIGEGAAVAVAAPLLAALRQPDMSEVAPADRSWVHVVVLPVRPTFVDVYHWFGPLPVAIAEVLSGGALKALSNAAFITIDIAVSAAARVVSNQDICILRDGRNVWILASGISHMPTTFSVG